jgi:hypothetical protein
VKKLLLLVLILGCVQPGLIRPNPQNYALDVPGLFLVKAQGLAPEEIDNSSPCLNHSTVILYYSEFNNTELSNYVVKITLNESSLECVKGEPNNSLYYYSNLTKQYSWFFDQGLITIEGTYSDLGRVEYNQTLLNRLIDHYKEELPPKNLKLNTTSNN